MTCVSMSERLHYLVMAHHLVRRFHWWSVRNVWWYYEWTRIVPWSWSLSFILLNWLAKVLADFSNLVEFRKRVLFKRSLEMSLCMSAIDDEAKFFGASSDIFLLMTSLVEHESTPWVSPLQNLLAHEDSWANQKRRVPFVHRNLNKTQLKHVPRQTEQFRVTVCYVWVALQKSESSGISKVKIQALQDRGLQFYDLLLGVCFVCDVNEVLHERWIDLCILGSD